MKTLFATLSLGLATLLLWQCQKTVYQPTPRNFISFDLHQKYNGEVLHFDSVAQLWIQPVVDPSGWVEGLDSADIGYQIGISLPPDERSHYESVHFQITRREPIELVEKVDSAMVYGTLFQYRQIKNYQYRLFSKTACCLANDFDFMAGFSQTYRYSEVLPLEAGDDAANRFKITYTHLYDDEDGLPHLYVEGTFHFTETRGYGGEVEDFELHDGRFGIIINLLTY
jgi:hypothetical protein